MERKDASLYTADELDPVDCSTEEQEVTITAYRSDDRMSLWVSDNMMLTKVKKCLKANPEEWKLERVVWHKGGTVAGYEFSFPKKFLSLKTKTARLELTDEQKAERRDRLLSARQKKQ